MKKILLALALSITFTAAFSKDSVDVVSQPADAITQAVSPASFDIYKAPNNAQFLQAMSSDSVLFQTKSSNACFSACAAEFEQCKYENPYGYCVWELEVCLRNCP